MRAFLHFLCLFLLYEKLRKSRRGACLLLKEFEAENCQGVDFVLSTLLGAKAVRSLVVEWRRLPLKMRLLRIEDAEVDARDQEILSTLREFRWHLKRLELVRHDDHLFRSQKSRWGAV